MVFLLKKILSIFIFLLFYYSYSQNSKPKLAQDFFLNSISDDRNLELDSSLENTNTSNFIFFFLFYKKCISRHDLPNLCRFHPTCGSYGALALKKHGFFKGTLATFDRLQRCNEKHYKNQYIYLPSENKYLDFP